MTVPASSARTLLGRAEECTALERLLTDIRRGESRSLVLLGDAGIGKTTLLEHLVDQAQSTMVMRAVGVEAEMELAFASLHQLCSPIVDRLADLPAPQRQALEIVFGLVPGDPPDQLLVGLAVLTLLSEVAEDRPLLCVVDDAQWLDRASALTLGFVARRLHAERLGLVFAARTLRDELRPLPELEIKGLPDAASRALLDTTMRLGLDEHVRDRIVLETNGNPLALMELPRDLSATELAGGFGISANEGIPGRIEESFLRRFDDLSADARRMVLLAAAEPIGDPLILWRASELLGIDPTVADEIQERDLLKIGERVTFRHPLARSAVYRAVPAEERRAVHLALAEATSPEADPDRRAWHHAEAASEADEQVAAELERSAGRAQARGGPSAAAAFLARAVSLTEDPRLQVERALAAARAGLDAGTFDAALGMLATAEAGPADELQHARADLLRAEIAFASDRSGAAPALLLAAAKRLEPLDGQLARGGFLQAMAAVLFAARLARPGGGVPDVADAIRAALWPTGEPTIPDLFLDGWASLFAEGPVAAAPMLHDVVARFDDVETATAHRALIWLATSTAPVIWDDKRWDALSQFDVELARSSGALSLMPLVLHMRTLVEVFLGEFETADALIDETRTVTEATGASQMPVGAVVLAAMRGRHDEAVAVLDRGAADAASRGEGVGMSVVEWARAHVHNGRGEAARALPAARSAIACPTNSAVTTWAMVEAIEAAARLGQRAVADEISQRFEAVAQASGTDWALGVHARSAALLEEGDAAEALHREALERLGRCRMRPDLARAHLLYGEWLEREGRRGDARAELRTAHEMLTAIGMEGFAERARTALVATGGEVGRTAMAPSAELTSQERLIARLAREGLTNPEIGVRLFVSPRTVEWHLRKVFVKLRIRSRRELADALGTADG